MHQHLIAALALALSLTPLAAQLQWERPNGPLQLTARFGTPLAHDIARSRTVLFGGYDWVRHHDETWEWDGAVWAERFPASRPPRRSDHGLCYDQGRNRVVMFGGTGESGLVWNDTWEWDGTNWVQKFPLVQPSPRTGVAMTYDFARGRSIVFGGGLAATGPAAQDPHWEWDGTTWTAGPPGPAPRSAAGLAHDWLRNRTVLFGGMGTCFAFSCPTFADTWEFDGSVWTQRPGPGPQARAAAAMTFDPVRGRVLLIGGQGNCMPACTATFNDAWEWDGAAWSLRSTAGLPIHGAGLAYDYGHTTAVEFGGLVAVPAFSSTPDATTRGFDGTNWTVLAAPAMPHYLAMHRLAFDAARARTIWFGNAQSSTPGRVETWEWNGQSWLQRVPATSPPVRFYHSMSYDSQRQRLVVFGGSAPIGPSLNDTWEWDGTTWLQQATPVSPPAQYLHAQAFDSVRGVTVLFPGVQGGSTTWEYDGVTWTPRPSATMPSIRFSVALAFDARRSRTVLFGGHNGWYSDETWEWDGANWSLRAPAHRPPARTNAGLFHDPVRERLVLFGGVTASGSALDDVWEWDGSDWTPRPIAGAPLGRQAPGLAWDSVRNRAVLFGGRGGTGSGTMQDTWELAVLCDRQGPGEVGGGGLPCACATPPRLGTNFCVGFANPSAQAAGLQFLMLSVGTCGSNPLLVPPPAACAPSLLYGAPASVLATAANPASFCFALPAIPAFIGAVFCMQGASLENPGCLRATDGLVVVAQ